jgi:hypothetical protein
MFGQGTPKVGGLPEGGQTGELPTDGLDFRRPVESQHAAEILRRALLETLGPLDAKQRHQDEGDQSRAKAVEGRSDIGVDLVSAFEYAAGEDRGHSQ